MGTASCLFLAHLSLLGTSVALGTRDAEETAIFKAHARRLQAGASCVADFDADGIVATGDLLYLLALFGRAADCSSFSYRAFHPNRYLFSCRANHLEEGLPQCAEQLTAASEQCSEALQNVTFATAVSCRDQMHELNRTCDESIAVIEAAATERMLEHQATSRNMLNATRLGLEAQVQTLLQNHATQTASRTAAHEHEVALLVSQHEQQLAVMRARYEQQLRAFRCPPVPVIAHADILGGDTTYGGTGATVACHEGYASNSRANFTIQCLSDGTWGPDPLPNCSSINPCSEDEDDCDIAADCAHTGPGTHSCECPSGVSFGTGQNCSPCSSSCGVGQVLIAPCTSTNDVVCEPVVASEPLPEIEGADLTYSNDLAYPTTGTYRCGGATMNRTLLPDGSWTAAADLVCGPVFGEGGVYQGVGIMEFMVGGIKVMELSSTQAENFVPTTIINGFDLQIPGAAPSESCTTSPCTFVSDELMEFMVGGYKVLELTNNRFETFVPGTINGFDLQVGRRLQAGDRPTECIMSPCALVADEAMEFIVDGVKVMELTSTKFELFVPWIVNGFHMQVGRR